VEYVPEPIVEEIMKITCGVETKLLHGICKIIIPDDSKPYFLF
jgi:hypothetical protein